MKKFFERDLFWLSLVGFGVFLLTKSISVSQAGSDTQLQPTSQKTAQNVFVQIEDKNPSKITANSFEIAAPITGNSDNVRDVSEPKVSDEGIQIPQQVIEKLERENGINLLAEMRRHGPPQKAWSPPEKTILVDLDNLKYSCEALERFQLPAMLSIDKNGYVTNVELITAQPDGSENVIYDCMFQPYYQNGESVNVLTEFLPGKLEEGE